MNGNEGSNNNGDGFNYSGETFLGSFSENTANNNDDDGYDLMVNNFGSFTDSMNFDAVVFNGNFGNNNGDHGYEMSGDLFVGTIDDNEVIDNIEDDGMFLDYDQLVARITNNTFHGNGNSGNEAGLYILSNDDTENFVLIENNNFGNDGSTENEVGLHVVSSFGSIINLNVIDNTFFSDDESVRIVSSRSLIFADGTVNLNLFDNETNNAYQLIRETGFGADGVFRLGYDATNENDVADQIATNGNTTNGGAPSTSISGENTSGSDYQFITRGSIPLPPVFP